MIGKRSKGLAYLDSLELRQCEVIFIESDEERFAKCVSIALRIEMPIFALTLKASKALSNKKHIKLPKIS